MSFVGLKQKVDHIILKSLGNNKILILWISRDIQIQHLGSIGHKPIRN
jgi:hypothetical protein